MTYSHILAAIDFSELSLRAMDAAKRIAQRFAASRVTLIHSYSTLPPSAAYPGALWPASNIDAQLREDTKRSLEDLSKSKLSDLRQVETVAVQHPNAALAIADYAAEHQVDLVVLGTHGRSGLAHFLLGSVAEGVVRHAPCPVLVYRPTVDPDRFPEHVLACTDFSAASAPGLMAAAMMAHAFESRVTVLHVYADPPALPGMKSRPDQTF